MIVWELVEESTETLNEGIVETVQATVKDRFHILISTTSNHKYWINILDTESNTIIYNGLADSLVATLNAIQQFDY